MRAKAGGRRAGAGHRGWGIFSRKSDDALNTSAPVSGELSVPASTQIMGQPSHDGTTGSSIVSEEELFLHDIIRRSQQRATTEEIGVGVADGTPFANDPEVEEKFARERARFESTLRSPEQAKREVRLQYLRRKAAAALPAGDPIREELLSRVSAVTPATEAGKLAAQRSIRAPATTLADMGFAPRGSERRRKPVAAEPRHPHMVPAVRTEKGARSLASKLGHKTPLASSKTDALGIA